MSWVASVTALIPVIIARSSHLRPKLLPKNGRRGDDRPSGPLRPQDGMELRRARRQLRSARASTPEEMGRFPKRSIKQFNQGRKIRELSSSR
jgi:hypothetical protein